MAAIERSVEIHPTLLTHASRLSLRQRKASRSSGLNPQPKNVPSHQSCLTSSRLIHHESQPIITKTTLFPLELPLILVTPPCRSPKSTAWTSRNNSKATSCRPRGLWAHIRAMQFTSRPEIRWMWPIHSGLRCRHKTLRWHWKKRKYLNASPASRVSFDNKFDDW